ARSTMVTSIPRRWSRLPTSRPEIDPPTTTARSTDPVIPSARRVRRQARLSLGHLDAREVIVVRVALADEYLQELPCGCGERHRHAVLSCGREHEVHVLEDQRRRHGRR